MPTRTPTKISLFRIVPCGTFFLSIFCLGSELRAEDTPASTQPLLLTMATENEDVKKVVLLGIEDTIMGWDERARIHFREALKHEPENMLAWGGLLLTEGATGETRDALDRILLEDAPATPQEISLLTTWLRLAQGEHHGAGEEFAERAARYRNDDLSACWAIVLLHDAYDELSDQPLPHQKKALALAEQLYEKHPQHPLVAYLRGWVEESAPIPSETALAAAVYAATAMPEHPSPHQLCGHLYFKTGKLEAAAESFHQAAERAGQGRKNVPCGTNQTEPNAASSSLPWPLEIRTKLYQSTVLWLLGKKRESLLIQSELVKNAKAVTRETAETPSGILLLYEARTLPLRLLMLSHQLPSEAQLKAAENAAALAPELASCGIAQDYSNAIRFSLVARQRAAKGKLVQAARCIQSAEKCLERLKKALEAEQGAMLQSALTRACEASETAILAAKAAAYENSSDIWLDSLEKSQRRPSLLMPPVLPHQKSAIQPIDKNKA